VRQTVGNERLQPAEGAPSVRRAEDFVGQRKEKFASVGVGEQTPEALRTSTFGARRTRVGVAQETFREGDRITFDLPM
jgi:hypothetical protein